MNEWGRLKGGRLWIGLAGNVVSNYFSAVRLGDCRAEVDAIGVVTRSYGIMVLARVIVKHFRLPLPEGTYAALRAEAERAQLPATTIAREAISLWLRAQKKASRRKAVMRYAAGMAGTPMDLDPVLEAAAIEELMKMDQETR